MSYRNLNKAHLESTDPQYVDTKLHYHLYSANAQYRITQLWGNEFAPFVTLGVGYLDITVAGNPELINIEQETQLNYGLGINVMDFDYAQLDFNWKKISGDAQLFELTFVVNFTD